MKIYLQLKESFIGKTVTYFFLFAEKFCGPIVLLLMRFWMARIFWYSGLTKIMYWPTTVALFSNEYKVPFLPPEMAAYMATAVELTCPILLVIGLASRLATIPMLVMTAVIQFTYMSDPNNVFWALTLGVILCYGPGPLSIDYVINRFLTKR